MMLRAGAVGFDLQSSRKGFELSEKRSDLLYKCVSKAQQSCVSATALTKKKSELILRKEGGTLAIFYIGVVSENPTKIHQKTSLEKKDTEDIYTP